MIVTLEISMYPLRQDYHDQVLKFLEVLHRQDHISIRVNALSTQVQGDHDTVMNAVNNATKALFNTGLKASFVMKLLPGEIDLDYEY